MSGIDHTVEHQQMIVDGVATGGVHLTLQPIVLFVAVVGTPAPRLCVLPVAATIRPAVATATSAFVFQDLSTKHLVPLSTKPLPCQPS